MKPLRLISYIALSLGMAGCASNPSSLPNTKIQPPVAKAPAPKAGAAAESAENKFDQLQAMLFGDTRQEMSDRVDHLGDRILGLMMRHRLR